MIKMTEFDLLKLSLDYILSLNNIYNIQVQANNYFFENNKNSIQKNFKYYFGGYSKFVKKYDINLTKDFIYKNDYFTTREMYLLSPAHYLYYTFNVFKLCSYICSEDIVDFSTDRIKVFYSGLLEFSTVNTKNNARFSNSYNKFVDYKNEFSDTRVLTFDIQDFFKNIKIETLISKLRSLTSDIRNNNLKITIDNLSDFLSCNFKSLPQLHYSIASSILSQIYLIDFTDSLTKILAKSHKDFLAVRFVDDFYVKIPKFTRTKTINNILDQLNYELWKDNLNLNSNKTRLFNKIEYQNKMELRLFKESTFEEVKKFPQNKLIIEKVNWLLQNDAKMLEEFLGKLNSIEKKSGSDSLKYKKVLEKYIEVDGGNISKVFNELIYSHRFQSININTLKRIISNNKYILFNPSQFTIFFILVNNYLFKKTGISYIDLLDSLIEHNERIPSFFKNNVIISNYFLQKAMSKYSSEQQFLKKLNKTYLNFIDNYILSQSDE
ncbi:hypothetical protein HO624_02775 [Streptococcus suis]|uniref:RNA-directed DNA polymerase n=1 Tax=Streptococcus suis TaxID=1307 RepID=UPI0007699373|nr:RNA-directed DNA polymerase [Streptococcus suis]NQH50360.1 hypothetical protein [Streptococcus suis]NQI07957.1 hypothetical protein [Streptococcus suis]NQN40736.1 hypothetical protein [Streptococcus suis]NQN42526.1 hypothetical protein [Streptococcus suis]NQO26215.1 hypothetical protein [Streptococcus suis]